MLQIALVVFIIVKNGFFSYLCASYLNIACVHSTYKYFVIFFDIYDIIYYFPNSVNEYVICGKDEQ